MTRIVERYRFRTTISSAIVVAAALTMVSRGLSFDKTKPQWPQLSTSHGPLKSGGTIKDEIQGSIDFLLTDMPMTDDELKQAHALRGVNLVHVATAVTGVVPCYNLEGISKQPLNFSAATLAAIFLGKIAKWNDPALIALNPSSHLPATDIIVVGHGQEDGSTYAFSDFLSKADPQWQRSVGKVRSLFARPVLVRGQTTEDVADVVKRTVNSIGYTELWAAKGSGAQLGRVRNRSGHFVEASPASIAAAAQTASTGIGEDFRASITDTNGSADYPIASFTWVVIPDKFADVEKRTVLFSFLKFVLTDGQAEPESMNLGRLPRTVADRELQLLVSVKLRIPGHVNNRSGKLWIEIPG